MKKKPLCIIIRDGWGKGENNKDNAIFCANTPFADTLEQEYPTTHLNCSGEYVGLPEGNQGNSEVGHLNLGAGRIIYQSLTRIDKSIKDGDFFSNPVFINGANHALTNKSTVHLIGLIQEEGVHAVTRHCIALLQLLKDRGITSIVIHAITDGRDTPPKSAREHLNYLQQGIDRVGVGRIATVIGRYYAMDRDNRWERTELAYQALMQGVGVSTQSWSTAINEAYTSGETDEFIKPRIINYQGINTNDVMIFFNFRFDRTRQLTRALIEPDFSNFKTMPNALHFIAMTHYYDNGNFQEAFPEIEYKNILGEVLAIHGMRQLRCAETEKYAHVTFFFNSLRNDPFDNEDRILINSPKVATYDLQPEMSAFEVRDKLLEAISKDTYDVIITNFANCDMVGHTGVFSAAVKAVETVDTCVREVAFAIQAKGGICLILADHGNAEQMRLSDGSPMTAHTTNSVPFSIFGAGALKLRSNGGLSDVAPTVLDLLGVDKPKEMTGISLILR